MAPPINRFLRKSQMKGNSTMTLASCTPEVTGEILDGWNGSSMSGLITAIENYNTSHDIPYERRVRYSVGLGYNTINVLHGYQKGSLWVFMGFDNTMGIPDYKYGDDGKLISAVQSITTTVTTEDKISFVTFGMYDPTIMTTLKSAGPAIPPDIKSFVKELKKLYSELHSLISSGSFRDYIYKFNSTMGGDKNYNSYDLSFDIEGYAIYTKLWADYIQTSEYIVHELTNEKMTDDQRKIKLIQFHSELNNDNRQNSFTVDELSFLTQVLEN